jgi:hypothetical protein
MRLTDQATAAAVIGGTALAADGVQVTINVRR